MDILVVGNVLKDVYLNLDDRTESFETDKNNVKWLDFSFNASEHHFFNRNCNLGGSAISLEVLEKMGLKTSVSDSDLSLSDDGLITTSPIETHRYILINEDQVSYLTPTEHKLTDFTPPAEAVEYLYIDRSANLNSNTAKKISAYLDISSKTKLVLYIRNFHNPNLNNLLPRASLVFYEKPTDFANSSIEEKQILEQISPSKIIYLSESELSYLDITENISLDRVDILTHLSINSILSATILAGFILGFSVEFSLKMARANIENSRINITLSLPKLKELAKNLNSDNNLEAIATNLLLNGKGILAADESNNSIKKRFEQLKIPDTYENHRRYRNLLFTTEGINEYINGVILFDETARQFSDNGQSFIDLLTSRQIIPGIKVDQGLEIINNSEETITKGLKNLSTRLKEYYSMGLRFAKWRSAFEIHLSESGEILTPTDQNIEENCEILSEYAKECQDSGLVPIIEPEVIYDGNYSIEQNAEITARVLDILFEKLNLSGVNLRACILKTNMVLAGKKYEIQSTPEEVGIKTAEILKNHIPEDLAGVTFLSGGQTPDQATRNLAEIEKNGPFPWPVTFSFSRAIQDPVLSAWRGDNDNVDKAQKILIERLITITKAL